MSLMRKQRLHTSFSEVRADLVQLPGHSISPLEPLPPPVTKTQFLSLASKHGQLPAWSSPQGPTLAQASTFLFSLLSSEWPAGCGVPEREGRGPGSTTACTKAALGSWHCTPQFLGVSWLKCMHPLFAAHQSATGGETEAQVSCELPQLCSRAAESTEMCLEQPKEPQPV